MGFSFGLGLFGIPLQIFGSPSDDPNAGDPGSAEHGTFHSLNDIVRGLLQHEPLVQEINAFRTKIGLSSPGPVFSPFEQPPLMPLGPFALSPEERDTVDALKRLLKSANLDPESVAERFWAKPVEAAAALNAFLRDSFVSARGRIYDLTRFDMEGRPTEPLTPSPPPPPPPPPWWAQDQVPRPSSDLQRIATALQHTKETGGGPDAKKPSSFLHQYLTLAALTSPAWFPIFVLPHLQKTKRDR